MIMAREFKLPDLGEGVHEGQVVRLLVSEGEQVLEDQPLMEVETDKAAVEIPSPYTGSVTAVHVKENQIVNVGEVMFTFDGGAAGGAGTHEVKAAKESAKPQAAAVVASQQSPSATMRANGGIKPASPAVRKKARELGVDLSAIDGSGPSGRVTMRDVIDAAGGGGATTLQPVAPPQRSAKPQAAARQKSRPSAVGTLPDGSDEDDGHGPVRRVPITMARRTIAQNMVQSVSTMPHVTDNDDADITELDALRRGYVFEDNPNRKLRVLPFAIRAVARALQRQPIFNSMFDAEAGEIIYRRYVNIAIGVHTERGLIAPVIRGVEQKSVLDIADALDRLAEQARTAGFTVADTRGGTFTISNAGAMGGSRYSTPIISPGQSAVLALGRSRAQPWVVGGDIVPRVIQPLSLSFDHRHIDGADEIAFMRHIIADLENPARVML